MKRLFIGAMLITSVIMLQACGRGWSPDEQIKVIKACKDSDGLIYTSNVVGFFGIGGGHQVTCYSKEYASRVR